MKRIWTKLVYDMASGEFVKDECEWQWHDGPVAECKGGSGQTTTTVSEGSSGLPKELIPYAMEHIESVKGLPQPGFYPGQTFVPLSAGERHAYGNIYNQGIAGAPGYVDDALRLIGGIAQGGYGPSGTLSYDPTQTAGSYDPTQAPGYSAVQDAVAGKVREGVMSMANSANRTLSPLVAGQIAERTAAGMAPHALAFGNQQLNRELGFGNLALNQELGLGGQRLDAGNLALHAAQVLPSFAESEGGGRLPGRVPCGSSSPRAARRRDGSSPGGHRSVPARGIRALRAGRVYRLANLRLPWPELQIDDARAALRKINHALLDISALSAVCISA